MRFPSASGTPAQVESWFRRHTGFTAHRLRHTFASRYIQSGGSVTKLQKILGHASVQTTMIYVHLTSEDVRAEIEELPSLPPTREMTVRQLRAAPRQP